MEPEKPWGHKDRGLPACPCGELTTASAHLTSEWPAVRREGYAHAVGILVRGDFPCARVHPGPLHAARVPSTTWPLDGTQHRAGQRHRHREASLSHC